MTSEILLSVIPVKKLLNELSEEIGGYEGNAQALRILRKTGEEIFILQRIKSDSP